MENELAIWWVSEADCKKIGEPMYDSDFEAEREELYPDGVPAGAILMSQLPMPDYIRQEYSSRYGRAGRGRLWIPDGITLPGGIAPWLEHHPVYQAAGKCGGIVFRRSDLAEMLELPGFVTDAKMNVLTR